MKSFDHRRERPQVTFSTPTFGIHIAMIMYWKMKRNCQATAGYVQSFSRTAAMWLRDAVCLCLCVAIECSKSNGKLNYSHEKKHWDKRSQKQNCERGHEGKRQATRRSPIEQHNRWMKLISYLNWIELLFRSRARTAYHLHRTNSHLSECSANSRPARCAKGQDKK